MSKPNGCLNTEEDAPCVLPPGARCAVCNAEAPPPKDEEES